MDAAAEGGSLDTLRFLHDNRTEGCTTRAMDKAAQGGHVDVVKFLHENRTEGCTEWAMVASARLGRYQEGTMEVVKYLVKHRPETFVDPTSWELNDAVKYLRSVWAESAMLSEDPVQVLRAAVIALSDLEAFTEVHNRLHPMGCPGNLHDRRRHSLLHLAIETEKDEFVFYLVGNCEHARASISSTELCTFGSKSRPLNLELLDLLMASTASSDQAANLFQDMLLFAAKYSNLPLVKALLERRVPCSEHVLMEALCSHRMEVSDHLMEVFPELITKDVVKQVAYRGDHKNLYKLCTSHPHLYDSSIVEVILCGDSSSCTTWEVLHFLHTSFPPVTVDAEQMQWVWNSGLRDDVLVFVWLVWKDPNTTASLAKVDRFDRVHLYCRLRACVPSLFEDVAPELPWCCQLRLLRRRVESGELTLTDVERARANAMPLTPS